MQGGESPNPIHRGVYVVGYRRLSWHGRCTAAVPANDLWLFDLREMEDLLERTKGHRGQAKVRAALELYEEDPPFARSGLERRFLEVMREAGLPEPATDLFVGGGSRLGAAAPRPAARRAGLAVGEAAEEEEGVRRALAPGRGQ